MLLLYNVTDSCTLTFSEMFTKLPVCSDDSTHPCFSFNDETNNNVYFKVIQI